MRNDDHGSKSFDSIPVGPQRCRHVGNHILDTIEHTLSYAIDTKGAPLTKDEIGLVLDELRSTPRGVWHFFQQSFEHCSAASKTAGPIGYERHNLLMRLVAGTFEHLFPETPDQEISGNMLSRSIMAPMEVVLDVMIGKEFFVKSNEACRSILDEQERTLGNAFTWNAFYGDEESLKVLLVTGACIARHFDDFENRKAWFIDMLNRHKRVANVPNSGGADFGEKEFNTVMSCLMGKVYSLALQTRTDTERPSLIDDEDAENIKILYSHFQSEPAGEET